MGLPGVALTMGMVALIVGCLIVLFYKELLVSSFDPNLAATIGISPRLVHYLLMCILSVVVGSAFTSVGAILVIAMLILPAATSYLLTDRLWVMMLFSLIHSFLSAIGGIHLAVAFKVPTAPATVVCGMIFFVAAWIFSPTHGLIRYWFRSRASVNVECIN